MWTFYYTYTYNYNDDQTKATMFLILIPVHSSSFFKSSLCLRPFHCLYSAVLYIRLVYVPPSQSSQFPSVDTHVNRPAPVATRKTRLRYLSADRRRSSKIRLATLRAVEAKNFSRISLTRYEREKTKTTRRTRESLCQIEYSDYLVSSRLHLHRFDSIRVRPVASFMKLEAARSMGSVNPAKHYVDVDGPFIFPRSNKPDLQMSFGDGRQVATDTSSVVTDADWMFGSQSVPVIIS